MHGAGRENGYHAEHGLQFPAFDVDLRAVPGWISRTTIVEDGSGRFETWCDGDCRSGYNRATGTFVVSG